MKSVSEILTKINGSIFSHGTGKPRGTRLLNPAYSQEMRKMRNDAMILQIMRTCTVFYGESSPTIFFTVFYREVREKSPFSRAPAYLNEI